MNISSESTYLWKMIWDCLTANSTLTTALGHTSSNPHIGRISQKQQLANPCLTFGQIVLSKIPDNDQPRILTLRRVFFQLSTYSEKSDAIAANLMELTLQAIVGEQLSYAGYITNPVDWDEFTSAPYFDENEKTYRIDSRIKIIIKQCG